MKNIYESSTNLESKLECENQTETNRLGTHLFQEPTMRSVRSRREYFRSMRAAEMAAWEVTGGDYLQSSFVKATPDGGICHVGISVLARFPQSNR